jgi:hypothetical protein
VQVVLDDLRREACRRRALTTPIIALRSCWSWSGGSVTSFVTFGAPRLIIGVGSVPSVASAL